MNKNHMMTIASLFIFIVATVSINTTVISKNAFEIESPAKKTEGVKIKLLSQQINDMNTLNWLQITEMKIKK